MAFQTIYNPATKQTLSIDLGLPNATQQIASYYQQGWVGSVPKGTPIPQPAPVSITSVATRAAPEGSIEWYQQQGVPLTPGGVLTQPQVAASYVPPQPVRPSVTIAAPYLEYHNVTTIGQVTWGVNNQSGAWEMLYDPSDLPGSVVGQPPPTGQTVGSSPAGKPIILYPEIEQGQGFTPQDVQQRAVSLQMQYYTTDTPEGITINNSQIAQAVQDLGEAKALANLTAMGFSEPQQLVQQAVAYNTAQQALTKVGAIDKDGNINPALAVKELGASDAARYLETVGVADAKKQVETLDKYKAYINDDGSLNVDKLISVNITGVGFGVGIVGATMFGGQMPTKRDPDAGKDALQQAAKDLEGVGFTGLAGATGVIETEREKQVTLKPYVTAGGSYNLTTLAYDQMKAGTPDKVLNKLETWGFDNKDVSDAIFAAQAKMQGIEKVPEDVYAQLTPTVLTKAVGAGIPIEIPQEQYEMMGTGKGAGMEGRVTPAPVKAGWQTPEQWAVAIAQGTQRIETGIESWYQKSPPGTLGTVGKVFKLPVYAVADVATIFGSGALSLAPIAGKAAQLTEQEMGIAPVISKTKWGEVKPPSGELLVPYAGATALGMGMFIKESVPKIRHIGSPTAVGESAAGLWMAVAPIAGGIKGGIKVAEWTTPKVRVAVDTLFAHAATFSETQGIPLEEIKATVDVAKLRAMGEVATVKANIRTQVAQLAIEAKQMLREVYGDRGAEVIANEFEPLKTSSDIQTIKEVGARLQTIGKKMAGLKMEGANAIRDLGTNLYNKAYEIHSQIVTSDIVRTLQSRMTATRAEAQRGLGYEQAEVELPLAKIEGHELRYIDALLPDYIGDFKPSRGYKVFVISEDLMTKLQGWGKEPSGFVGKLKLSPKMGESPVSQDAIVLSHDIHGQVVAHEMGHAIMGHLERPKESAVGDFIKEETEAEAVGNKLFGRTENKLAVYESIIPRYFNEQGKGWRFLIKDELYSSTWFLNASDLVSIIEGHLIRLGEKPLTVAERSHLVEMADSFKYEELARIREKGESLPALTDAERAKYEATIKADLLPSQSGKPVDIVNKIANYQKPYEKLMADLESVREWEPAKELVQSFRQKWYKGVITTKAAAITLKARAGQFGAETRIGMAKAKAAITEPIRKNIENLKIDLADAQKALSTERQRLGTGATKRTQAALAPLRQQIKGLKAELAKAKEQYLRYPQMKMSRAAKNAFEARIQELQGELGKLQVRYNQAKQQYVSPKTDELKGDIAALKREIKDEIRRLNETEDMSKEELQSLMEKPETVSPEEAAALGELYSGKARRDFPVSEKELIDSKLPREKLQKILDETGSNVKKFRERVQQVKAEEDAKWDAIEQAVARGEDKIYGEEGEAPEIKPETELKPEAPPRGGGGTRVTTKVKTEEVLKAAEKQKAEKALANLEEELGKQEQKLAQEREAPSPKTREEVRQEIKTLKKELSDIEKQADDAVKEEEARIKKLEEEGEWEADTEKAALLEQAKKQLQDKIAARQAIRDKAKSLTQDVNKLKKELDAAEKRSEQPSWGEVGEKGDPWALYEKMREREFEEHQRGLHPPDWKPGYWPLTGFSLAAPAVAPAKPKPAEPKPKEPAPAPKPEPKVPEPEPYQPRVPYKPEPDKYPEIVPVKYPIPEPGKKTWPIPGTTPKPEPTPSPTKEPEPSKEPSPIPFITPMPIIFPSPSEKPYPMPGMKPQPQPKPKVKEDIITETITAIEAPAPYPTPTPAKWPYPELEPYPEPQPAPEPYKPPPKEPTPTKITIIKPPKDRKEKEDKRQVAYGTWIWRHGAYWEVLEPPYDHVVHMKNPPEGAYLFATGKGSAKKTLQIIPKGARPPRGETRVDIGWAEAVITVDSTQPGGGTVKFIGHSKGRPRKGQTKAEKIARGEIVEEPKKRGRPKKEAEETVSLESISEFPEDRIDRSQVREGELVNVESKPRSMRQEALAEYLPARVGTPAMKEVTLSDIEASIPAMRHFTPRSRKKAYTREQEPYARYYLGRRLLEPDLSGALK